MAEYPKESLPAKAQGESAHQYLTFSLADEEYGVDILRVQEIRGWEQVTRIPNSPPYVKGVLNLRGAIVPIFDLRQRFDMAAQEYGKDTVVIILRVTARKREMRNMGVVVDAVSDVLNARASEIRSTPDFGAGVATEYISGLASDGDKMIMLLDVDRLLNEDGDLQDVRDDAA
jgi:purine-binding chemotaxis protein CheW